MGKFTAIINSIPTSGFGHIFDWSSNLLSRKDTWSDYIIRELKFTERFEALEKNKMMSSHGLTRLKHTLKEIESWKYKPTLCHGDMRLKNVLVNEKGKISAILDWELCCSNVAPYWDMSIALHDLNVDEKEAFINGYGIDKSEFRTLSPGIKALNLINYVPYMEGAIEKKDKEALESIRLRLHGCLDMYTFDEDVWKKMKRWLPFKIGKD
jgi:hygromycin-B 4-O-kinase